MIVDVLVLLFFKEMKNVCMFEELGGKKFFF